MSSFTSLIGLIHAWVPWNFLLYCEWKYLFPWETVVTLSQQEEKYCYCNCSHGECKYDCLKIPAASSDASKATQKLCCSPLLCEWVVVPLRSTTVSILPKQTLLHKKKILCTIVYKQGILEWLLCIYFFDSVRSKNLLLKHLCLEQSFEDCHFEMETFRNGRTDNIRARKLILLFYSHMLVMWIVSTIRHFLVSLYGWMVMPHASQTDFRTSSALRRQQSHSSIHNATEWWQTTWHLQQDYRGRKVAYCSWFLRRPCCLPETLFEGEHSFIYSHLVYVLSESYVSLAFPWGKTRLKSNSYQCQSQGRLLARREKRFPCLLNGTFTVQKRFHLPELLREQCAGF